MDEVAVFQGASYFRSLGRGQRYGLSARGLAIGAGEPNEEFPDFTSFWLERPPIEGDAVVVHALMDSPSCAGVYSFTIRPGRGRGVRGRRQRLPARHHEQDGRGGR